MSRLLGRRPSPAMIVALLALIVAMGGTSYAAIKLPANSVGTKQLKAHAVTSAKVKDSAITSRQIKDRSLLAEDFRAGQIIQGPQGPAGPPGLRGPQGQPGAEFVVLPDLVRRQFALTIPASGDNEVTATCGPDEVAVSGGLFRSELAHHRCR
jgi:hypothetical protein